MVAAKDAVNRLFKWCLLPDAGNPKHYLAGAVAIVAEYPLGVMERLADPCTGTRVVKDYPTLPSLRRACEELNEPFARSEEHAERRLLLPMPALTEEERERRRSFVARLRQELGIPAGGLPARGVQARGLKPIPPERLRNLVDSLVARKASKEALGDAAA